ncbi:MAG TPA: HAD family hydrolase [Polyangiaceae bacterium]|nr:HAD family hydrolase [Polyangiaceae bacterium]
MTTERSPLHRPHTVTFDCWSTLLYEGGSRSGSDARARIVADFTGRELEPIAKAFGDAWKRHQMEWHRRTVFDGRAMTKRALETLGVELEASRLHELVTLLEEEIQNHDIVAVDGAARTLERLASLGVRRALICDTGFTPGRVVRRLLARTGLLPLLEVTIFSEEVGVPKPDVRAFDAALAALGVSAAGAVHVGDLRRSDIAGARAANMGSVRFAGHHDDADEGPGPNAGVIDCAAAGCAPRCPRPEADAVIRSYAELCPLLGLE